MSICTPHLVDIMFYSKGAVPAQHTAQGMAVKHMFCSVSRKHAARRLLKVEACSTQEEHLTEGWWMCVNVCAEPSCLGSMQIPSMGKLVQPATHYQRHTHHSIAQQRWLCPQQQQGGPHEALWSVGWWPGAAQHDDAGSDAHTCTSEWLCVHSGCSSLQHKPGHPIQQTHNCHKRVAATYRLGAAVSACDPSKQRQRGTTHKQHLHAHTPNTTAQHTMQADRQAAQHTP